MARFFELARPWDKPLSAPYVAENRGSRPFHHPMSGGLLGPKRPFARRVKAGDLHVCPGAAGRGVNDNAIELEQCTCVLSERPSTRCERSELACQ